MQNLGQERLEAFVVGGSGGIGRAIVLKLAEIGCNILIHGRSGTDKLDQTCSMARAHGVEISCLPYEFGNTADFLQLIPKNYVPDILIVAFGPLQEASLEETNTEMWQRMIDANLGLPGTLVSKFGPQMAKRGFGRIILFGGTNTDQIRGFREVAAYAAAKTGLGVLAKSAAREFGAQNVTCNVICPGYVETENYTEETLRTAKRRMPGNSMQSTENMAKMAVSVIQGSENGLNGAILSCAYGM